MKIVNRTTFLAMPAGTLYSKYGPSFGELEIKGDSYMGDFTSLNLANAFEEDLLDDTNWLEYPVNSSHSLDLGQAPYRDGEALETKQLFAVWEKKDLKTLMAFLQKQLETE